MVGRNRNPQRRATGAPRGRSRSGAAPAAEKVLPDAFLPAGATVEATGTASPAPAAEGRRAIRAPLELSVATKPDESVVLAVRMPSGALRLLAPTERATRAARGRDAVARFVIPAPRAASRGVRRGLVGDALKWVVVKIGKKAVDAAVGHAMAALARMAERKWWGDRREGLFRVGSAGGVLRLSPVSPDEVAGPALLLLHGTFSHAVAAFGDLSKGDSDFFAAARQVYGEHIYAWDHFTVSKSPEDNAREFLDALPARPDGVEFDVVTHSRGGLVLRTLVERADDFAGKAARFRLRRAVLVAAPNAGTPLATPDRWEETLGFVANVLELFTPNPWTMAAGFVADGLVWLAARLAGDLPGLASMDGAGETIAALQEAGALDAGEHAALAANFHPTDSILARLLDAGLDSFFRGANDLVVPAEGSWLADDAGTLIPAERIGCFGDGGNLDAAVLVHHLNFFGQPATADFLRRALGLPGAGPAPHLLDPATVLPTRGVFRGTRGSGRGRAARSSTTRAQPPPEGSKPATDTDAATRATLDESTTAYADRTLHLMILEAPESETTPPPPKPRGKTAGNSKHPYPMLVATYSNARVIELFPTRSPEGEKGRPRSPAPPPELLDTPGHRFRKIIEMDQTIRACLEGRPDGSGEMPELPNEGALGDLGEWLFRALFIGDVRRLYDAARAEQRDAPLNIVLTCAVPWLAALPWEFAYDPMRRKFLASEEVHFTRGVMAAVPAEVITRRRPTLRLLVVSAQPADLSVLSIQEEKERIRHAFHALTEDGLIEIDVLADASPEALQQRIMHEQFAGRSFDVVHFISHGEFEPGAEEGRLLLVGTDGHRQELEVRPLREMLASRDIHLVFLNACESGVGFHRGMGGGSRKRGARGLAQSLVEGGLPAVVANQYTVLDSAALTFAECFYRALALGASLGQAAREARIALNYSVDGDAIDWAVPVLYARDPDTRFCVASPHAARATPARRWTASAATADSPLRGAASATQAGPIRVGIADISKHFPQLPATLARLNAAQSVFAFLPVPVAIPLGVWKYTDEASEDGTPVRYLWAERFARKMKDRPKRLGVHYLLCATHHLMCSDDFYAIYGWWSSDAACPILLFSTGGLALPRDGDAAGRVVANAIVQSLACQIVEEAGAPTPIHEDGPKDCPFYFNEERVEESIVGPNRFDARCRARLRRELPAKLHGARRADLLRAFDALLDCFATRAPRA